MICVIYVVHESPGRLRLRMPWLRDAPDAVHPLADRLAGLEGMEEVRIRPWTGSVLCLFDPTALRTETIVATTREQTGVELVLRRGERSEEEERALVKAALENGSAVARSLSTAVKGMNYEVLRASGGRLDLGTLTAAGFAAVGAATVVATGKFPIPPWFNLSWWAFGLFTTLETAAIQKTSSMGTESDLPEPPPSPTTH